MNYFLAVWSVITSLAAVGSATFWRLEYKAHGRHLVRYRSHIMQLEEELIKSNEMHESVISAGETERIQNQAAIADLYEALTECQDKYKALERQTVEVETPVPARPTTKRNNKGQFAKKAAS